MSNVSLYQRVLVVDDEPLLRWAIRETISGVGHAVITVPDASSAIREIRDTPEPFDVVLVSHPLLKTESFALLAYVQRRSPATAVVFMPVHGLREDIFRARQLGAVGVLHKPFDLYRLHRAVFDAAGI